MNHSAYGLSTKYAKESLGFLNIINRKAPNALSTFALLPLCVLDPPPKEWKRGPIDQAIA